MALVQPDWVGKLAGFTLLFEALVLMLAQQMPFAAVARIVGESPWISGPGPAPSAQPLWEQKLYSVVSVQPGVILKSVPPPLVPPSAVVP